MKIGKQAHRSTAISSSNEATILVHTLVGGTPSDPKVAEAWLKTKLGDKDDIIRERVAEIMVERGITADEAAAELDSLKHLNGFLRDENGLYHEGRKIKACIKEAASVAASAGKLDLRGWGKTNKGIQGWIAEHVFVLEDRIPLGVVEPSGVMQRFVHTFRGNGIQYEEYVTDAKMTFTVVTDHKFTDEQWAMLWLTAEQQGTGATRSQGYGTFSVERWEKL